MTARRTDHAGEASSGPPDAMHLQGCVYDRGVPPDRVGGHRADDAASRHTDAMQQERLRMLYLMHLPWGWIKQRPHFLAEHLNGPYQVSVYCRKFYIKKWLVDNSSAQMLDVHELCRLPMARYHVFDKINEYLAKHQLSKVAARYELFWITYPSLYDTVRDMLPEDTLVIYDCMDDALAFPVNKASLEKARRLSSSEQALVERADLVIVSSEHLRTRLQQRYGRIRGMHVVNNAVSVHEQASVSGAPLLPVYAGSSERPARRKLMYIGTISEWIDIGLILESLSRNPDIVYYLIGPKDIELPDHPRLMHIPPVEHRYVSTYMQQADALILPFRVTELVRSVNPVKIYEYISSGKPVLAVAYDETRCFSDYVHIYGEPEEYHHHVDQLVDASLAAKQKPEACESFARQHSWANRTQVVQQLIDAAYCGKHSIGNR